MEKGTTNLQAVEVSCSDPLSSYPSNTQRSRGGLRNNPGLIDQSEHWPSRKTMGRLATVGWDVGVVLTVVSIFLLIARIVGTASASNGVGEDVRHVGSFGLSSRRSR